MFLEHDLHLRAFNGQFACFMYGTKVLIPLNVYGQFCGNAVSLPVPVSLEIVWKNGKLRGKLVSLLDLKLVDCMVIL